MVRRSRPGSGSNRLVLAGLVGMLVWLADQPTVDGYNPLLEMFWNPGLRLMPFHDLLVLACSWVVTTLFCHFLLFTFRRLRG